MHAKKITGPITRFRPMRRISGGRGTPLSFAPLIAATVLLLAGCASRCVPGQAVVLAAHRGASQAAPENTLAAIDLAWTLDADLIEVDFYLTADGELVAHHDSTTKRTAGVDRRVEDQTLEELKALDVGSWKDAKWAGERIATLGEVFGRVPADKGILIELKSDARSVPPLVEIVRGSALAPKQMTVICFQENVVERVKQSLPQIRVLWLASFEEDDGGRWQPTVEEIVATAGRIGADGVDLNANVEVIDEAFVAQLREADLEFHVWTVDDPEVARRMRDLGAHSITTNRPGWLREQLKSSGVTCLGVR
jgi:glycerophosphoryl diester phosphodiesterase